MPTERPAAVLLNPNRDAAAAPLVDDDDGIDVSLIRWMLSLTPAERLAVLQGFVDSVNAVRDSGSR